MPLLALLLALPQGDHYNGRFFTHPNLETITRLASDDLDELGEELPKWLTKDSPRIEVKLVDLAEPLEHHIWPGAVPAQVEISRAEESWSFAFELPVDTFIADPTLVLYSLQRNLFAAASTARAMDRGADLATLAAWGMENPLIEALAAYWAGSIDQEIEFVLRRHLGSEEELASLLQPIVVPADGGIAPERRGPDDLTYLLLVRMLAPKKKDKKLETLYSALENGQPFEGALKKASGKKLERLDEALRDFYRIYVKHRFPKKALVKYRRAQEAFDAEDWDELLDAIGDWKSKEWDVFLPHVSYFLACADAAGEPEVEDVERLYCQEALLNYAECDFGAEILLRYLRALRNAGQREQAAELRKLLRDGYGWLASVRAETDK